MVLWDICLDRSSGKDLQEKIFRKRSPGKDPREKVFSKKSSGKGLQKRSLEKGLQEKISRKRSSIKGLQEKVFRKDLQEKVLRFSRSLLSFISSPSTKINVTSLLCFHAIQLLFLYIIHHHPTCLFLTRPFQSLQSYNHDVTNCLHPPPLPQLVHPSSNPLFNSPHLPNLPRSPRRRTTSSIHAIRHVPHPTSHNSAEANPRRPPAA